MAKVHLVKEEEVTEVVMMKGWTRGGSEGGLDHHVVGATGGAQERTK